MRTIRRTVLRPAVVLSLAALIGSVIVGLTLGRADRAVPGHGVGPSFVVGLGDSYLSGEAGRWAGNTHAWDAGNTDALGSSAYSGGSCHRTRSAEPLVTANSVNLACSGARTMTTGVDGDHPTPGLDFYAGRGQQSGSASWSAEGIGQALALQRFASTHTVSTVVVSIGGNNVGFGSLLGECVQDYVTSVTFWQKHCHSAEDVRARFTDDALAQRSHEIATALRNVATAMTQAGYSPERWTLVLQDYPSPLPPAAKTRYGEKHKERQLVGGCGLWNSDLDWADTQAVPTIDQTVWRGADEADLPNLVRLELQHALDGHRLCEKNVGKLFETNTATWRSPGAADRAEWVSDVRTTTLARTDFSAQESLHPNYWGQLALRSCLRQVVQENRRGACKPTGQSGLDGRGEPHMRVRPTSS